MTAPFIAGIARAGTRSAALSFAGLGLSQGVGWGVMRGALTHTTQGPCLLWMGHGVPSTSPF